MNSYHPKSRLRQKGIAAVLAVIFLFAVVIFALSQTLGISASNSTDNMMQGSSEAALFLAESGLERAQGLIKAASSSDQTACTKITAEGSYPLPRGNVIATGIPCDDTSPNPICGAGVTCSGTGCTECIVAATGTVGTASRTIQRTFKLTAENGVACNITTQNCTNYCDPSLYNCSASCDPKATVVPPDHPCFTPTWSLKLKNTDSVNPAVALFDLAIGRKGAKTGASCPTGLACAEQWDLDSSTGSDSVNTIANAVSLCKKNGTVLVGSVHVPCDSYTVYQTQPTNSYNEAEVGAVFHSTSAAGPSIVGSYWNQPTSQKGGTIHKNSSDDNTTNSGVASLPGSCTTALSASQQSCDNWCYGGDRLVFGFAGARSALKDGFLSTVQFNTNGTPIQNVTLKPVAQFPTTDSLGAPANIFAEIWSVYNPNLSGSSPIANNASSYKGNGTGWAGATFSGSVSGATLTVTSAPGYPTQTISPGASATGDTLSSTGLGTNVTGNPTLLSQSGSTELGGGLGGRGTYQISDSSQTVASRSMTAHSNTLHVTACTICFFAPNDPVSSTTITSQTGPTTGGIGTYTLNNFIYIANGQVLAGNPGTTIYVPATGSIPTVPTVSTDPKTRIAIYSGIGSLQANTTVTSVIANVPNAGNTSSFVVTPDPTDTTVTGFTPVPLNNATICAGTCAFFDHPNVTGTSNTTVFAVTGTVAANNWASGFLCLKGSDVTPVAVTTATKVTPSTWTELIQ